MIASGVRYDLAIESPEYVKSWLPTTLALSEDRTRGHREPSVEVMNPGRRHFHKCQGNSSTGIP